MDKNKNKELNSLKEDLKKPNIIIFGVNGAIYNADKEKTFSEETIKNEYFNGSDEMTFTSFSPDYIKNNFNIELKEGIRLYFVLPKENKQPWNYNAFISYLLGVDVYSSICLFVSEGEINNSHSLDSYESFYNVIIKIIELTLDMSFQSASENENTKENAEYTLKFKIKSVNINICKLNGYDNIIKVDFDEIDKFWEKYFVNSFNEKICFNSSSKDMYSLLNKPGELTAVNNFTGDVDIYFSSYNNDFWGRFLKKFKKIADNEKIDLKDRNSIIEIQNRIGQEMFD